MTAAWSLSSGGVTRPDRDQSRSASFAFSRSYVVCSLDPDGGILAAVPLDDGLLSEKAIRVSVTLPSRLLTLIDRAAGPRGRSGLLAEAVVAHLGRRKPK